MRESFCFGISLGSWKLLRHGVILWWARYGSERDECSHLLSWLIGLPGRDVILKRKKESVIQGALPRLLEQTGAQQNFEGVVIMHQVRIALSICISAILWFTSHRRI